MGLSRREVLKGTAGTACLAAMPLVARAAQTRVIGGAAFGTYWRVTLPVGPEVRSIKNAIGGINAAIDLALSPFRPDSEISRFNQSDSTDWITLGEDTAQVVQEGLRIAALTCGGFDPSVAVLARRLLSPM